MFEITSNNIQFDYNLRNGILNDKYEKREQREYLKLLTDWIKLNNECDKRNNNINYFQDITIK